MSPIMRLEQDKHPELYQAVGAWLRAEMVNGIGTGLRRHYRPPRLLPPGLLVLLARLDDPTGNALDGAPSRRRRRSRVGVLR